MAGRMDGAVAIVTGGGSGIGRACALGFAREGAKVVVADVLVDGGEETADLVRKSGGEVLFVRADVSKAVEVESLVAQTVGVFGRLDFACNNAGVEGVQANTTDCTEENWDRTMAINLKGAWLCMKYEIPRMLAVGGGAIVNMSSVAGISGFRNLPAYAASKGGMNQLTKAAALEFAKQNVRVNAVCPGVIRTAMVDRVIGGRPEVEAQYVAMEPIGRLGRPEEIADAVLWLCSKESSFVTGHLLVVDGGLVVP